ncbi:unnamed protein product [Rotaria sordida]|uniref:Tubulin/FtsZ GTPase domain-containing protein n=1 Tax=Rotaria sordida TaxID=392033 RepID=A0A818VYS0_9BILA|nr:unnamed protein product [Rotaria sordida]
MANDTDMNHREIFQLHIGSTGVEIGNRCWELYCLEHNLAVDGSIVNETEQIGQKLIMDMKQWWRFSDLTPTGFKCGINYCRPYIFNDESDLALTDKQVCALINETATSKYLCEMGLNQLDQSSKAQDETTEFIEAQNYLQGLREDYQKLEQEIINDNGLNLTTPFV